MSRVRSHGKVNKVMKIFILLTIFSTLPIVVISGHKLDSFICKPWSNAGLGIKGDFMSELSGLNLVWTNDKLTQTAVMMNPEDKLENNTSDA